MATERQLVPGDAANEPDHRLDAGAHRSAKVRYRDHPLSSAAIAWTGFPPRAGIGLMRRSTRV